MIQHTVFGPNIITDSDWQGIKTNYIQRFGMDPRLGTKAFCWNEVTWMLPALGRFRADQPGRAIHLVYDVNTGHAGMQWAANPQQAIQFYAAFQQSYYGGLVNGDKDWMIDTFANGLKANNLNHEDVTLALFHEGTGFWYEWSFIANTPVMKAAVIHVCRRLKEHNGIVCRIGIDHSPASASGGFDSTAFVSDPALLPWYDSISFDPYFVRGNVYPPPVDDLANGVRLAGQLNKFVDLPEVGLLGDFIGSDADDVAAKGYFTRLRDVAMNSFRADGKRTITSMTWFLQQPRNTTHNPDGSVQYSGTGANDFILGIPVKFPNALNYFLHTLLPDLYAASDTYGSSNTGGTPPPPPPPPTGGTVTIEIVGADSTGNVTNAEGRVTVKVTNFTGKVTFWKPANAGSAGVISTYDANGVGSLLLPDGMYYPYGDGGAYPDHTPITVTKTVTPPPPPPPPPDTAQQIADLTAQVATLKTDLSAVIVSLNAAKAQLTTVNAKLAQAKTDVAAVVADLA